MIKQPVNSKLCGHCCLATILNITLEQAIELIGHCKGTKTKELIKHFDNDGLKRGYPNCYSLCISRPPEKRGGNWHWILYDGRFYDPLIGEWTNYTYYRISSYIPIL